MSHSTALVKNGNPEPKRESKLQLPNLLQKVSLSKVGAHSQEKYDKKVDQIMDVILKTSNTVQNPPCGDLEEVAILGQGAYGRVYKVEDKKKNFFAKKVVSKIHHDFDWAGSVRELSALATFRGHPCIMHAFDTIVEIDDNEYSIVMELMDGDLRQFWENEKKITTRMAHFQTMAYQILSALAFMHSEKIAHRDIKSQNIFYRQVGEYYQVKLGDFGLTRRLSAKNYTGGVITYCYRPPEMLFSDLTQYGTEIDIWSAGMVFTEMILGCNAVEWEDGEELIKKLAAIFDLSSYKSPLTANITPKGLSSYLKTKSEANLGPLLLDLLEKMMNVDPFKRISAKAALKHPYFRSFKPLVDREPSLRPQFVEPNTYDWTLKHAGLTTKMRTILVEWLREVAEDYECSVETYSQCIEIVDAFMTKNTEPISKGDLQLIGIAAMLISSAMNEVAYISEDQLIWISDDTYTKKELIEMTWKIFNCLEHRMPRTRLPPSIIKTDSLKDLKEICEKYCSSFPSVQL